MSSINLPDQWLQKVAFAIGKSIQETQLLIEEWYDNRIPLKEMEFKLIKMARDNNKELIFSPPGLN